MASTDGAARVLPPAAAAACAQRGSLRWTEPDLAP